MAAKQQGLSEDTKTIITVLLLIFVYPIGLIMMFVWTRWPNGVKALLLIPLLLFILGGLMRDFIPSKSEIEEDFPQQMIVPSPLN